MNSKNTINLLLRIKSNDKGFTLIELLVVMVIIGILAAIALPSFLNQSAKARQSEAKTYIGSINRAQQAYRIENPTFAGSLNFLEIGIPTATVDYTYLILGNPNTPSAQNTTSQAIPTDGLTLRAYAGGVSVVGGQTSVVSCQTTVPSDTARAIVYDTRGSSCGVGSEPMR